MSSPRVRVPHPPTWPAFEDLCWGLWKEIWKDAATKKNGRNGQPQNGVDIFGQPSGGRDWAGLQCKGKDSYTKQTLTEQEVREEMEKAKGFKPSLTNYAIATTAPRDSALQEIVRTLSDANVEDESFSVDVYAWEDIEDRLWELWPPIAEKHYPQIFGGEMRALGKQLATCGTILVRVLLPLGKPVVFMSERQDERQEGCQVIPENPVCENPTWFQVEEDVPVSHETLRMVVDVLYAKQQEIVGLASTHGGDASDVNPLFGAIDRAVQMRRARDTEGGGHRE